MSIEGIAGTTAFLSRPFHRKGWQLFIEQRTQDGKILVPESITWKEIPVGSIMEPLYLDQVENFDSLDKQSQLAGANERLLDEVAYHRSEISKLLSRIGNG